MIFIDSAKPEEVRRAAEYGWVAGVTTNPSLLAQAGLAPNQAFEELAQLDFGRNPGKLFYQLTASTYEEMVFEAEAAYRIAGPKLVLKVPPNERGFRFASWCPDRYRCCVTAIFSPIQAAVASEAGAKYIAVYVNRATRHLGDGIQLVREIAAILAHSQTRIVAASIKSADEAAMSLLAGAHDLTLPFSVLSTLIEHPLSAETITRFDAEGVGLAAGQPG